MLGWLKSNFLKNSLTAVDKDTVTSSEGWRLQFIGNSPSTWRLHYFEGEKHLEIGVETGIGGPRSYFWYVYLSGIKFWQPPHDRKPVHETDNRGPFSEIDRKRVAKNIRAGTRFLKSYCKIV
jgi:hypothetical protein